MQSFGTYQIQLIPLLFATLSAGLCYQIWCKGQFPIVLGHRKQRFVKRSVNDKHRL